MAYERSKIAVKAKANITKKQEENQMVQCLKTKGGGKFEKEGWWTMLSSEAR